MYITLLKASDQDLKLEQTALGKLKLTDQDLKLASCLETKTLPKTDQRPKPFERRERLEEGGGKRW